MSIERRESFYGQIPYQLIIPTALTRALQNLLSFVSQYFHEPDMVGLNPADVLIRTDFPITDPIAHPPRSEQ